MVDLVLFFSAQHPTLTAGLICSDGDWVNRYFFSFGRDSCAGTDLFIPDFRDGLLGLRATVEDADARLSTYFIREEEHIWLLSELYTTTVVQDLPLTAWLEGLLAGNVQHIGP